MHSNPYEAPETSQPRSPAVRWPWLLTWKGICISAAGVWAACLLARFLTAVFGLHDPGNPLLVASAIANLIGINLAILVFAIAAAVCLIRWLFKRRPTST